MMNSVAPDEMAHYEPSQLDLHCLQKYLYWSAWMKGLKIAEKWNVKFCFREKQETILTKKSMIIYIC